MQSYSQVDSKKEPLDFKLDKIINKNNGFFIELGANNGLDQSNTAFFEFNRGWTGLLIEPSYEKFIECTVNRKQSIVKNYACVSCDYKSETVRGDFNGSLMSSIDGKRLNNNNMVEVQAITLEKLLDSVIKNNREIDFLSLDTEGYELNILLGLNLNKYRPRYMLIEIYNTDFEKILLFLTEHCYGLHSNFSNYNYVDNPHWDGTHNDYLFIDMNK
jgi:FkbM family methyltransferase